MGFGDKIQGVFNLTTFKSRRKKKPSTNASVYDRSPHLQRQPATHPPTHLRCRGRHGRI